MASREGSRQAFEKIKAMDTMTISTEMAAKACGLSSQNIRWQAKEDAKEGTKTLPFKTIIAGTRVEVVRQSFIEALEGGPHD